MSHFQVHDLQTAPEESRAVLEQVRRSFGFIPNLTGVMAEAPTLLEGYLALADLFERTSLSPAERQVVLLSVSAVNACGYCMAAHSLIARNSGLPEQAIEALRQDRPISEVRLEALRRFTAAVVDSRGWPGEAAVESFLGAGYSKANVLEVILGVGMKTLSNYTNHLAATPVDEAFAAEEWKEAG